MSAEIVKGAVPKMPPSVSETDAALTAAGSPRLGELLLAAGSIRADEVQRVLDHSRRSGRRFGETAVALKVTKRAELERALAKQFDYPYLEKSDGRFAAELIAAYDPFTPKVEALRGLRAQLLLGHGDTSAGPIAIVSPERREGRSFIAANLAVVFSQLGKRTLLIDAHVQSPRQHEIFRVDNSRGFSTALISTRSDRFAVLEIPEVPHLHLLPAGPTPPNAADLLAREAFAAMLEYYRHKFSVVICDTPPGSSSTVADTVAARCGKALVVVRRDVTRHRELQRFVSRMRAGADVVGAVLNRY